MSRILVVEDNDALRDFMWEWLNAAGYEADVVANGSEGLNHLGAYPAPGLVLLDIDMPVMDGLEFRRRQLTDARLESIPVLCVTGTWALERLQSIGLECLHKPLDFDQLLDHIARVCQPPAA
jgi:CheY-like chemotaxis protein